MDERTHRPVVTFGAVMMIVGGAINVLDGIVGLASPDYFTDPLFASTAAWAVFFGCYGLMQVAIGIAILRGSVVAIFPGIIVAVFNAVTQLVDVGHYPVWSIAAIAVDFIVIYAFAVYGMSLGTTTVPDRETEVTR